MSLKHASYKADVDLRVWVKGSSPSSPIRTVKNVYQADISSLTLDVDAPGWPCSTVPHPGCCLALRSTHWLALLTKGYSWTSWVMKRIRTIVPVWIKYKMFLLHLSLVVDAEVPAVNRMDEVIHPRPYAPSFWQFVVHKDSEPTILLRPPWTCHLRMFLTPFENHLNFSIVDELGKYPLGWWFC